MQHNIFCDFFFFKSGNGFKILSAGTNKLWYIHRQPTMEPFIKRAAFSKLI